MSDDFEFMASNEDPAAEFLAREAEELGDLGDELGLSQTTPSVFIEEAADNGHVFDGKREYHEFGTSRSPAPNPFAGRDEPESIKKWRVENEERLKQRDEDEAKKKDELRVQAQKELTDWYRHYEETLSKTMALNREKSQDFIAEVDEIVPGTEWERVSKLCNFNVKSGPKHSKDVTRLKSIMLQLKQSPIEMKY